VRRAHPSLSLHPRTLNRRFYQARQRVCSWPRSRRLPPFCLPPPSERPGAIKRSGPCQGPGSSGDDRGSGPPRLSSGRAPLVPAHSRVWWPARPVPPPSDSADTGRDGSGSCQVSASPPLAPSARGTPPHQRCRSRPRYTRLDPPLQARRNVGPIQHHLRLALPKRRLRLDAPHAQARCLTLRLNLMRTRERGLHALAASGPVQRRQAGFDRGLRARRAASGRPPGVVAVALLDPGRHHGAPKAGGQAPSCSDGVSHQRLGPLAGV